MADVEMEMQKKRNRITNDGIEALVAEVERNPALHTGPFVRKKVKMWEDVADRLNKITKEKTPKEWQLCWASIVRRTRQNKVRLNDAIMTGNPTRPFFLSALEERVLSLIGLEGTSLGGIIEVEPGIKQEITCDVDLVPNYGTSQEDPSYPPQPPMWMVDSPQEQAPPNPTVPNWAGVDPGQGYTAPPPAARSMHSPPPPPERKRNKKKEQSFEDGVLESVTMQAEAIKEAGDAIARAIREGFSEIASAIRSVAPTHQEKDTRKRKWENSC